MAIFWIVGLFWKSANFREIWANIGKDGVLAR
jgi:hypothetical protein